MRAMRARRVATAMVLALPVIVFAIGGQHRPAFELARATPAAVVCHASAAVSCPPRADATLQTTAERGLAERYAPVLALRRQPDACEQEAFRPMPVEVLLGNPRVRLVRPGPDGTEVQWAPSAADLYRARAERGAYLDLPGHPGRPGCTYMRDFGAVRAETPAVAYAHIRRERGFLALQYWFLYYFNDWNNQHESDWEMIQLLFRAESAAEALVQEPLRVSYAQHSGGETRDWDDPGLVREGDHPVVYVSAGSHASYFAPTVYLGLGEAGAGLGCDYATGPSVRVPLEARLVPADLTGEAVPDAWDVFQGRWGERRPGQNNGPRGPNATKRWAQPVTHFDDDISDYNVVVPRGTTIGPNAVDLFCRAVGLSGRALGLYYLAPLPVGMAGGALLVAALAILGAMARRTFLAPMAGASPAGAAAKRPASPDFRPAGPESAIGLYLRHLVLFLGIGAVFIPIGIVAAVLGDDVAFSIGGALDAVAAGLPLAAAFVFVNGAVAAVMRELDSGRRPTIAAGYRMVWQHLGALTLAALKVLGASAALSATIVGLPVAIALLVRWLFVGQAIVLDGADSRTALPASARAVAGHWWRSCLLAIALGVAGALAGPVVAIVALLFLRASADAANLVSSAVCALTLPLVFVALTRFYQGLTLRRATDAPDDPGPAPASVTTR